MAANDKAKTIKIKAKVGDQTTHPVALNTNIAVNAMPFCVVEYAPDAKEAIKSATSLASTKIFSELKKAQESTFDPQKSTAEVSAVCKDTGAKFSFSGMPSCPSYNFSVTNVRRTDSLMASFATVNAMDLSIYKLNPDYDDLTPVSKGGPLNNVIKDVFNFIIDTKHLKHYEKHTEVRKFVMITHKINQANKEIVNEILENSKQMGWDDLKKYIEFGADWKFLLSRIASVLMANNGGFFNNLVRLAEDFQCIFIPSMTGEKPAGKFVSKMYILSKPKKLKAPIVSLNASLGSMGMYPVAAVASKANNPTPDYDPKVRTVGYVIYPNSGSNQNGISTILSVPGPAWFNCPGKTVYGVRDSTMSKDTQDKSVDIAKAEKKPEILKKSGKDALKVQGSVMEQWTKCAYYWQALGQTSVYLNCEFMDVEVGKYYNVINEKGKSIFKGLLYSVTHNISSEMDDVSAETRLMFTHVRMKNAKIPGIE